MGRMMPDMRFQCPRCGSSEFGSALAEWGPLDGPMQRYCHGYVGRHKCRFTWPDKDDWKYFLVDGVRLDVMEYDAVMAKIRATPAFGVPIQPSDLPFDPQ